MAKEGEGVIEGQEAEDKRIWMRIELNPDKGTFSVDSNRMRDQILCMGLLEQAKITVIQYNVEQQIKESKIIKPHGIIDFARKKKRF